MWEIPKKTIFAARLNPKTDEDALRRAFSECGEIKRLRLVRDIVTGFSRGYGFIEYEDVYSARKAFFQMNKTLLDGSEIFVDYELERTLKNWVPRRLGGGFGGKKESGQLRFGGRDRPFKKPILVDSSDGDKYKKRNPKGSSYQNKDFQRKNRTTSQRGGSSSRYPSSDYRNRREPFPSREKGFYWNYESTEREESTNRADEHEQNVKSWNQRELDSGYGGDDSYYREQFRR